jgi:predicted nucleic acid-binding protein
MKMVVVDTSVAAKWLMPEPDASHALRWLDGRHRLAAPDLLYAEVSNIAWKLQARGLLGTEEALDLIAHLLSMPVDIYNSAFLLAPALEIAVATKRPVYDSLYLALALELDAVVITADRRWVNTLIGSPFARFLRLLGQG